MAGAALFYSKIGAAHALATGRSGPEHESRFTVSGLPRGVVNKAIKSFTLDFLGIERWRAKASGCWTL
jgi:hypothetical protein